MDTTMMKTNEAAEDPVVRKKIGQTTYLVRVHFNPDSNETLQKKMERMLVDEVRHADLNNAG